MKTAFPAQLKTDGSALDVIISMDGHSVEISTGDELIGWWAASECRFERTGPHRYRFRAEVTVRVPDDVGFGRALGYMKSERVPLVPRWLAVTAATVVVGVVAMSWIGTSEEPAQAAVVPFVATQPSPTNPTTVITATPVPTSNVLTRWNDLAPSGSGLELAGLGTTQLTANLSVSVTPGTIRVVGTPSTSAVANERLMAALGMAIGASSPDLSPAERRKTLERLGIDVTGGNRTAIDGSLTTDGLELHLVFNPGTLVDLTVTSGR
jgi:hypothetical protein